MSNYKDNNNDKYEYSRYYSRHDGYGYESYRKQEIRFRQAIDLTEKDFPFVIDRSKYYCPNCRVTTFYVAPSLIKYSKRGKYFCPKCRRYFKKKKRVLYDWSGDVLVEAPLIDSKTPYNYIEDDAKTLYKPEQIELNRKLKEEVKDHPSIIPDSNFLKEWEILKNKLKK